MGQRLPALLFLVYFFSTSSFGLRVGSKNFTENYILAEIFAQKLSGETRVPVEKSLGMGGTGILATALRQNEIDLYPEYTGTIAQVILKERKLQRYDEIQEALLEKGLRMSPTLGFQNNYALALNQDVAKKLKKEHRLESIEDLKHFSPLKGGLSYEFLKREDGWQALKQFYALENVATGMEHALSYRALTEGGVDFIEVYTTDSKIQSNNLFLLKDNKQFFPSYEAVFLVRKDFPKKHPKAWRVLQSMRNGISTKEMRSLNAMADGQGVPFAEVAKNFLKQQSPKSTKGEEKRGIKQSAPHPYFNQKMLQLTWEHLYLVFLSLIASIIVGVPLGIIGYYKEKLGHGILLTTGLLQTIPALALLCFLIPFFGVGTLSSVTALFLYGLLPIVRNTTLGMSEVLAQQRELTKILGLTSWQRLSIIEFPLAFKSVMAGIKTSATINVGMATLAAFIGAGGYGTLIATGLALDNTQIILQGAIPSAILAIIIYALFELLEKVLS